LKAFRQKISNFTKILKSKWLSSRYDFIKFITKNQNWLDNEFSFPNEMLNLVPTSSRVPPSRSKNFANFSE